VYTGASKRREEEMEFFFAAVGFGVVIGILAYYVAYAAFRNKSKGNREK
jgi:hypothetical protein